MLAAFFVWFAGIVGNLSWALGITGFVLATSLFCWFAVIGLHNDAYGTSKSYPLSYKGGKLMLASLVTVLMVWALIPSERTVYMMGGAYIGQSVVQSDASNKVKLILEAKLDSYLQEMEGKVKKVEAVVDGVKEKSE